jgi:hypothetical protein
MPACSRPPALVRGRVAEHAHPAGGEAGRRQEVSHDGSCRSRWPGSVRDRADPATAGLGALRRFVDDLLPLVEIAWVDEDLHREAREALLAAGRRTVSLADWTSFLVMRRHGVRRAFTFDPDFGAEGFEVVPAG